MEYKVHPSETTSSFFDFFLGYRIFKTNIKIVIGSCFLVSFITFVIAISIILSSNSQFKKQFAINETCLSNNCTFMIHIDEQFKGPFYIFVGFKNFFVNNRKVINSFDLTQLQGNTSSNYTSSLNCKGYTTVGDARRFYPNFQIDSDPKSPINPSGQYPLLYSPCFIIR